MSRKRNKERVILQNINIEAVAAEGNGLAHVDGKVLFVPKCVPGDVVDVVLTRKRKGFMQGDVVRLVEPSPIRQTPFCPHYGICGGCTWQALPYEKQLEFKQQQVVDQLTRIGHLTLPEISPILGSEKTQFYRNKLEYTFSDRRWVFNDEGPIDEMSEEQLLALGFHIPMSFSKVLDIKECKLQREPSNAIRLFVKDYAIKHNLKFFDLYRHTGFLRNLVIRTASNGEVMIILVIGAEEIGGSVADSELTEAKKLMDAVMEKFPEVTSAYYVINNKGNDSIADLPATLHSGKEYITEEMEGIRFRIGPKSFYQTNSEQAYRLYSVVREFADLQGDEILYDLYTGTGTIALFLSGKVRKVVGIEYVEEAIEDAKINAKENNIDNAVFYAGDMKDVLNKEFISRNGRPDVIVLDPPRAGIHPSVAQVILDAAPQKMVYVSCNPASQARDLAVLCEKYDILKVRPVDMFPHTQHVENVVLLKLKEQ
ncbi:MAG: 23S rRNA (uracil(1939)-C(5))-methyltransferase RlmD [Candidatus Egerieousia sp.]